MPAASRIRAFIEELKRRRVFRVAAVYLAAAFVALQVADLTFEPLGLPAWAYTLVLVLLALGLPIALVLAWAFDVVPAGERRADEPDPDAALTAAGPSIGRGLLAAGAVVVLLGVGVGGWLVWRSASAGEASERTLAVLPFAVRAGPDYAYLGEGLVELLARNLDGAAELRAVDPGTVLLAADTAGAAVLDARRAGAISRRLGAGLFLLGSVHEIGGQLRLEAALHRVVADSSRLLTSAQEEGAADSLFALVDRLSAKLLGGLEVGAAQRIVQVAAVTTPVLPALKQFLAAERHLRNADFDSAIAAYQRAIEADSAFGLAHYRLAVAAGWDGRFELADSASRRALAHSGRLSQRERRLLQARVATFDAHPDSAETAYRRVLEDYPDDMEATFQLADLLYHHNPPRGRPRAEAGELFEQVYRLDPEFLCPI